jgi:hypothetical protein
MNEDHPKVYPNHFHIVKEGLVDVYEKPAKE